MPQSGHILRAGARKVACFCLLLAAACPSSGRSNDAAKEAAASSQPEQANDQVAALIRELGAGDYARRENAQAKLRRMGLDVFDQLYDAMTSDDIEIALRARYVLHSLNVRWAQDDDPLRVKELLRSYGEKSEEERRSLVEQLANLPENQGVVALCRIARFETSNVLSKYAALSVMQRKPNADATAMAAASQSVTGTLGTSRREAAHWLRVYVSTLTDPAANLQEWARITEKEEQTFRDTPDRTTPELVRDLLRWRAELLDRAGREQESLAVVLKTLDLLDGTRQQLLDAVDWLLERRAWPMIEEVAKRFPERFQETTVLLYRLAETQSQSGRHAEAEKTAERALKSNPDSQHEHLVAAYSLQERGLFEWCEREYRFVVEHFPPSSQEGLQARIMFSEMLHDLLREKEAGEALRDAVAALEKDENVRYLAARIGREPGSISSRMHYFLAEHSRLNGDIQQHVEHLKKAIGQDSTDADVLIAIYRASEKDPVWRKESMELIRQAASEFRENAIEYERQAAEAPTEDIRAVYHRELAAAHNQLAWLVSNTEGDYDEALRASQRSLELRPETAGYIDTLARCLYAKGDYKSAVQHQSHAAELDPHSAQIRRQLEFFRQALEAAQGQSKQ